jgi:hypothetical protein
MWSVSAWSWIQHHRWLSVLFLAFFIVGTAGGTCWAVFFRTASSPVTLKEALRLYRRDQSRFSGNGGREAPGASAGASAGVLTPGVYRYQTSGGESLSIPGADRSFPALSDMLVTSGAPSCSVISWVPLSQHTETTTVCAEKGVLAATRFVTHEVIDGSTTTTVTSCPTTTYFVPPITMSSWSAVCRQSDPSGKVVIDGRDLGPALLDVGGQSIETTHVRLTMTISGSGTGTAPMDFWISTTRGLLVRELETVGVNQQGVHYNEHMLTELMSLIPESAAG